MRNLSQVAIIYYFVLLWLKVTSYEFDCSKLLDVCPGETVQVYCRDDNKPGSTTIMWLVRSSLPNKSCGTAFGVDDSYGTVKELDCHGRDTDRAELLSKVPNSTNLILHLTPDMANVTCRSTSSPASKSCPIAFKGKPSPPVNVSYVRRRDDQVLVMWTSTKETSYYKIIVASSQTNESYNRTLHRNSASLTIKRDVDYNITVIASNCAGESLPSELIMILSPPAVNVAIKKDNLAIAWNQVKDECFIMKIEGEQNLECSKRGDFSRKLTSHKLYEIQLLSKANGSLVTGSLWRKQYCVAYSVSPQPRVNALVLNNTHTLQVNVTLRSYCDPGELLQDCLCPMPSEIILQLEGENKTHHEPTETTINIHLSDMSSGSSINGESAVVFGTVWVKNDCGMSEGVHFFAHLPVIQPKTVTDDPPTNGIGCIVPSLVLLPSLLILLALLFV